MQSARLIAFLLACALTHQLYAQAFIPQGTNYFGALSRNGQHYVTYNANGDVYRWSRSTNQVLPLGINLLNGYPAAISDDGAVIAGYHRNASNQTIAFRWTASTGFLDLGDLPGGTTFSMARGMSADGSVIVGSSGSTAAGTRDEAFRWTAATGMVALGDLAGGNYTSTATSVSADGSVIVGYSNQTLGYEAFRWTQSTGLSGLGDIPGGFFNSQAYKVSSDGNVIAGYSSDSLNREQAFRWTLTDGMVALGFASPNPNEWSQGKATNLIGTLIGGNNNTGATAADIDAIIWDPARGMRYFKDALVQDHALTTPNWNLTGIWDISDDGRTIAGSGYFNGVNQSWVFIPEPTGMIALSFLSILVQRSKRA